MGPLEGYLTDKVGTRRMVFIGMIFSGCVHFLRSGPEPMDVLCGLYIYGFRTGARKLDSSDDHDQPMVSPPTGNGFWLVQHGKPAGALFLVPLSPGV
ncbi:MAG: hypothetical protein Ct9H300mP11_16750 [Chloroflexota bacterium]|nr:MAG: hypothetical protein Ct9H300mP11_16750 [Chloroflexota bacterium]